MTRERPVATHREAGGGAPDGPLLSVRGLRRGFRGPGGTVEVLRGCSLEVARGEVVAVVGRSGSGKSTLLAVLGLLDSADAGEYVFDGVDVSALTPGRRARLRNTGIGFVFQQFHLLPRRSALANVGVPMVLAGVRGRQRRAAARELLESVGLGDRTAARPHQLSGGEQQRVALARALSLDPALVLADEPTGALDEDTGALVLDHLLGQARVRGTAVVVATHAPEVAARADRVLAITDGRVHPTRR